MQVIVGKVELDKKLSEMQDIDLSKALLNACLIVEASAKEKCPSRTGILRESITSEADEHEGRVGTNLEYGVYVHQGTGIYATNGDGRETPWRYQDAEGN